MGAEQAKEYPTLFINDFIEQHPKWFVGHSHFIRELKYPRWDVTTLLASMPYDAPSGGYGQYGQVGVTGIKIQPIAIRYGNQLVTKDTMENVFAEISTLEALRGERGIAQLLAWTIHLNHRKLEVLMELPHYAETLYTWLHHQTDNTGRVASWQKPTNVDHRLTLSFQLIHILQILETREYIHGDINTANLMVEEKGVSPTLVLIDFGLAQHGKDPQVKSTAYAFQYRPYEMFITSGKYQLSYASDVYAAGLVIFDIFVPHTLVEIPVSDEKRQEWDDAFAMAPSMYTERAIAERSMLHNWVDTIDTTESNIREEVDALESLLPYIGLPDFIPPARASRNLLLLPDEEARLGEMHMIPVVTAMINAQPHLRMRPTELLDFKAFTGLTLPAQQDTLPEPVVIHAKDIKPPKFMMDNDVGRAHRRNSTPRRPRSASPAGGAHN